MTRTPAETNQIIHEAMGLCWHCVDPHIKINMFTNTKCVKCGSVILYGRFMRLNYLEHGKPWGEMINWAMTQEWWMEFVDWYEDSVYVDSGSIVDMLANPSSLAEHIAEYLSKEEGK